MNTKYYNPVLSACLTRCIQARDWKQLYSQLGRLSNAEFRNAEGVIAEVVLPDESLEGFWTVYNQLIRYRGQAFMVCVVRSTRRLVSSGRFSLACKEARATLEYLNTLDVTVRLKFVKMVFPLLKKENDAQELMKQIELDDEKSWIVQCLACATPLSFYMMFKQLKLNDVGQDMIIFCIRSLMKIGSDDAFNMASILQSYFGLEKQLGVYALHLEPYEISYLDSSYNNFLKVLNRI